MHARKTETSQSSSSEPLEGSVVTALARVAPHSKASWRSGATSDTEDDDEDDDDDDDDDDEPCCRMVMRTVMPPRAARITRRLEFDAARTAAMRCGCGISAVPEAGEDEEEEEEEDEDPAACDCRNVHAC
jgi:hypothetical protein